MNKQPRPKLTGGELRIRRAFILSVVTLATAVVAALIIYWLSHPPTAPEQVEEASIEAPPQIEHEMANQPPAVRFTDITESAGITFVHTNGARGERLMPETLGSGAAFIDYDRDGDQDLFLVNSRRWDDDPSREPQPGQVLYQNDGSGHFHDVTADTGLSVTTYGMGTAIGDYDGDGWDDLYLTSLNGNQLFRNTGGRFEDVTGQTGVAGGANEWSSSATFVDYDKDGDLDLFVVNYVKWSKTIDLEIDFRLTGLGRAYGAPLNFTGTQNRLYRNEGQGRFTDVSATAGIQVTDPVSGRPVGKGLGIVILDYDGDGWLDLMVANDTVRNLLYRNRGDGSFEEVGIFEGVAYDRNGKATSAMGIDAAQFRNDLETGILVGNFANEMCSLFVTSGGKPPLVDEAVLEGLGPASRIPLTFALVFLDYDLDGELDILLANGHLEHEIHQVQQSQTYAQPPQLFWSCGDDCRGRFVAVDNAGDLSNPLVGRGIAYADIDADGDLDILITQNGRRPALLRNEQQTGHHWLGLKLVGRAPNTSAIGARIELTTADRTLVRRITPSRGYLSQIALPLTVGLGDSDRVDRLSIEWPDGNKQTLVPNAVDQLLVIEQDPGEQP